MKARDMDPSTLRALADEHEAEAKHARRMAKMAKEKAIRDFALLRAGWHEGHARRYRGRATRAEAWRR